MSLLGRTVLRAPLGRVLITPIVCRWCDWDQFEVAADECFCEGCCLPVGIADGDVHEGGSTWELAPSAPPRPQLSTALGTSTAPVCPAGHDVFEAAIAYAFDANGQVRHLSVGLRCPVDGAMRLHLDNRRVATSST
ncbi:hypothetical protein ABZ434_07410 [Streptomyces sp. NPDC005761]|uniref:hypothetical protein n=1 Tax=unclassified Streptomyces TaxID=2593676 RepID=UPI0033ED8709